MPRVGMRAQVRDAFCRSEAVINLSGSPLIRRQPAVTAIFSRLAALYGHFTATIDTFTSPTQHISGSNMYC
jgi:hypothetical protein